MFVRLVITLICISTTVLAIPTTYCTMWPDARVSVGYTWNERCRNCTCVEGQGNVCDGPKCEIPYESSHEMICAKWDSTGCCCEALGCMVHGRMYAVGEYYPRTRGNPCDKCMCSVMGNRTCRSEVCQSQCVNSIRKTDECCPVCPNGPNCVMPNLYAASKKPVTHDSTILKQNHYVVITDPLNNFQTWNCTCTVGGGMAQCDALHHSWTDMISRLLSSFTNKTVF